MKNMKKILLIIILFNATNFVFAQKAPGYLGKTILVSYSGNFFPAVANPNKNGEQGFTSFNYIHKVSLDYVINRKGSIGFAFETYTTGVDYDFNFRNSETDQYGNTISDITYYPNGYGTLNVKGISIYKSIYRKGISPLGKHTIFGLKLLFASTDLSTVKFTGTRYDYNYYTAGEEETYNTTNKSIKNMEIGFIWGYGVNRIIQDFVVLNFGFELTLLPSAFFDVIKENQGSHSFSGDQDPYAEYKTEVELFESYGSKRLFRGQFFNIKISIGFLAH
jgi:hypothetical protein